MDFNTGGVEPFVEAAKEVLGEDNVYLMVAYGTMKDKAAFRNYCRALNLNINDYNDISNNLDNYKEDPYWGKIIKESEIFLNVIDNIKPSPCSYILLNKPISKEFGLIKIKDQICCITDGYWSDYFKYLKNDFLVVIVWEIISETFKIINKPIPNIRELTNLLDNKIWDLYKKGLTATLNQTDTDHATKLIQKYKPKSIAEISAFVAAIRPGFASMLNTFLNREEFKYNIPEFDELLSSSQNFCLYQENVMQTLIYAGFPEDETYGLIKLIAKKRAGIEKIKDRFIEGFINKTGSRENAEKVWQIIEDNAGYSFNSSHSLSVALDSLYGAYLKVNYPLEYYTVVLNKYVDDIEKTEKIINELLHFNIEIKPIKFRKSLSTYTPDKQTNSIYKGIASIKYLNSQVAEDLYRLKDNQYNTFVDLLIDIKNKTSADTRQIEILISLNYFSEFYNNQKLLNIFSLFQKLYNKKHIRKDKIIELNLDKSIIKKYSEKETEKLYKDIDMIAILREHEKLLPNESLSISDFIRTQQENFGYIETKIPNLNYNINYIQSVNTKYSPIIKVYNLSTGQEKKYKISKKIFKDKYILHENDFIIIMQTQTKNKQKLIDGKWIPTDETEEWITSYYKANPEKLDNYINKIVSENLN